MHKKAKTTIILSLSLLITTSLYGCGNKVDEIDYSSDTELTDTIDTTIETNDGKLIASLKGDIIRPDANTFPVATTNRVYITDDYIQSVADALFDNEDYHNSLTDEELSSDQLLERIDELNTKIDNLNGQLNGVMNNQDIGFNFMQDEDEISYYIEESQNEINHIISDLMPIAPDSPSYRKELTMTPIEKSEDEVNWDAELYKKDSMCSLEGIYNNMDTTLGFEENNSSTTIYIQSDFSKQQAWGEYIGDRISYSSNFTDKEKIPSGNTNECAYTYDNALKLCKDMLNTLGIADMDVMVAYDISMSAYPADDEEKYTNPEKQGYCGYEIYFGKSINGVTTTFNSYLSNSYGYNGSLSYDLIDQFYKGEVISFTVLDCGIVGMFYRNPTVVDSISTTDTVLLPFDDIYRFATGYITTLFNDPELYISNSGHIRIDKIELGLTKVCDNPENDTYTLIPTWSFFIRDTLDSIIIVNAIDGSWIEPYCGCSYDKLEELDNNE